MITETLPSVEGEQVSNFVVVTLMEMSFLAKQWTIGSAEISVQFSTTKICSCWYIYLLYEVNTSGPYCVHALDCNDWMLSVLQVEIEVIGEGAIEVEETGLEEVVDAARNAQASDDSALALLADITSKYQQGEPALHIIRKGGIEEVCWFLIVQTLI